MSEAGDLIWGDGAAGSSSRSLPRNDSPYRQHKTPQYMTVGSGSVSETGERLVAMLDKDSGYGGSVNDGGQSDYSGGSVWDPGFTEDRPTPGHTTGQSNPTTADDERRILASHVHQQYYNRNRAALGRAINNTVETLKKLQQMNTQWPAHYPSVQRSQSPAPSRPEPREARPGLLHTQSTLDNHYDRAPAVATRPRGPQRAGTSIGEASTQSESSTTAIRRPAPEPRLITPQLAEDFSVLKIDLKIGGLSQAELVHSLEKGSIASLLDGQISKSIRHLLSLRERIEDTSSKVLVTGDLNAGKSTFCNALLRRKILPVDQQPCTSIFCEVLDFRENAGVEEVHAIPIGFQYNRNDERTYQVYELKQLERVVTDNERFSQCKVYLRDIRQVHESLLNNGTVDIALIDAPGLNNDSLKTTAVFARQEEIDVVVFVVSAANHFTLSAKEFIFNAAREKAYIFMVVNGFDNIRDKNRCQRMILEQVRKLSPATFKESSELVHFVSSNAIPVTTADSFGPSGGNGNDPSEEPEGDDDDEVSGKHGEPGSPAEKGKGKEREKVRDFEELEASLRRFVLEKRARSKLAPAKTYLMNVLGDLNNLATINRDVAQSELDRVTKALQDLEPVFEQSKKARSEASDGVERTIEEASSEVYTHTRETLNTTIARVSERDLGVQYPGLLGVYDYAEEIKHAMLQEISETVSFCEGLARDVTIQGVSSIKRLGMLHLGDSYVDLTFRSDLMFRRKRDALARQVAVEVEIWDFFDLANLWERQEKVAGTSMAVTVAGVVGGRMLGGFGWVDGALGAARVVGANNMRRLIIPGLIAAVALGITYALRSIPTSLPRRLSAKLSAQLSSLDYVHTNALRISSEVRRALKYPADNLKVGLQRSVEQLQGKRDETGKVRTESEVARKYFGNLIRDSDGIRRGVEEVDLEGPAPGIAGAYDF